MRYQLDAYRMWLDEFCKEVGNVRSAYGETRLGPLVTSVEVRVSGG